MVRKGEFCVKDFSGSDARVPGGGVIGTAEGVAILDDRSLGVLQRVLLTTDGTVVPLLEGCFDEPIRTAERIQAVAPPTPTDAPLELEGDETVLHRRVLLQGTRTGRNYIYAESAITLDRLPSALSDALLETGEPIGRLLADHRLETFREILDIGRCPAGPHGGWFGLSEGDELLCRTYRIIHGGRPTMRIAEYFPSLHFLGQGGGAVERELNILWDLPEGPGGQEASPAGARTDAPMC